MQEVCAGSVSKRRYKGTSALLATDCFRSVRLRMIETSGGVRTGKGGGLKRSLPARACGFESHPPHRKIVKPGSTGIESASSALRAGSSNNCEILGDGTISTHPRDVYRLRIFLDRSTSVIVAECQAAMSLVMPASRASCRRDPHARMFTWSHTRPLAAPIPPARARREARAQDRAGAVAGADRRAPSRAAPPRPDPLRRLPRDQHDPPPEEDLRLSALLLHEPLARHPADLLRACDRLGIAWRQDGPWNISIARQEAVAIMDRHVGPKR